MGFEGGSLTANNRNRQEYAATVTWEVVLRGSEG